MAIENTYLLGKNITLGCGFDLQAKAPLDSRQTVPAFAGLQALIDGNAAYEGMIVYDEETKKTYQAQLVDGVLAFREFGINEAELKDLIASETTAAMEFKGATAALPENPAKGDMWKVTAEFAVGEETAKIGDSIVYNGEQWFLIPSGDDIEDTWRPVTDVDNDATLTFAAGDKLDVAVAANGTVTYSHEAIDAPTATPVGEDEQTRTYIASIETDGHGHITGYKTATENVEDTNTEYTFEGQSDEATSVYFQVTSNEEGASAEVIYLDAYSKNEANDKFVEKVTGKQLSTEDFTTELLNKLNGIADEANKYEHAKHTAYAEGFYKVTVDAEGHVSNAVAVTKEDIVALGIPGQDTTYEKATADADGLMSKEHFTKVEGIYEGATKVENVGDGKIKINDQEVTVYEHPEKHAIDDVTGLQDALNGKLEVVKVNGTALEIKDKAVDITVPTGALASKDEVAKDDLAEALATEIDNKVAKEDGKSLVLDTEITKLAGVSEGANKVENVGGGKIKIDGTEVTVYAHPDKHAISEVDGLETALAGLQAKGDYAAEEHTHTKDEITDFAHTHTASEIADFATEVAKVKVENATKADEATKATQDGNGKVIADTYAEKATTLAGYGITDAYTKGETDTAVQGARDYAKGLVDAIPAQTDYSVTITETTDGLDANVAKKYTFTQNGAEIGSINLAKELVVTSGSVKEVTEADAPYAGAVVGDKYIELVIANQDAPIYVPAKDLVDIYTAKDGAAEVQVAISNTNEISATLVNGGITEEKLHADVKTKLNKVYEEVGVAKGLVDALADGQVKTNKEAIEAINNAETGILKQAKDYADGAINDAKTDASNKDAVVLSEAQKYAEGKVNALAGNVYTKEEVYTKTEVENLLTWGSF